MNSNAMSMLLLVFFVIMIYFLMIRPQKKKEKADKEMRDALKVGDEIMTIGGVMGKVVKITEKSVVITTGAEKTKIEFIKSAIASVSSNTANKTNGKKSTKTAKTEETITKKPDREKKVAPKKLGQKKEEASEESAPVDTVAEEIKEAE